MAALKNTNYGSEFQRGKTFIFFKSRIKNVDWNRTIHVQNEEVLEKNIHIIWTQVRFFRSRNQTNRKVESVCFFEREYKI